MHRKILFIMTLIFSTLTISACSSISQIFKTSHGDNNYTYDPFWDNQRIIFRNILVTNEYYNTSINNKASNFALNFPKQRNYQQMVQNRNFIQSVKYSYGKSVNDSFNGVTEPFISNTINIPNIINNLYSSKLLNLSQQSLQTISDTKMNLLPRTNLAQEIQSQQLVNYLPGTTCQPLTIPVPPPPSIMKGLNMPNDN